MLEVCSSLEVWSRGVLLPSSGVGMKSSSGVGESVEGERSAGGAGTGEDGDCEGGGAGPRDAWFECAVWEW